MKRIAFCFLLIIGLVLGACGESSPTAEPPTPTRDPFVPLTNPNINQTTTIPGTPQLTPAATTVTIAGTLTTTAVATTPATTTSAGGGTTAAVNTTTASIQTTATTTSVIVTTPPLRTSTPAPTSPPQNLTLIQIDTGLQLYPTATAVSVGANFENTIGLPYVTALGGNAPKIKYKVYTTTQSPARVLNYYEDELAGMGLVKVTSRKLPQIPNYSLPANGIAYAKDDTIPDIKSAGVAVVGPMLAATISQLSPLDPAFGRDVKIGDTLIILASGL